MTTEYVFAISRHELPEVCYQLPALFVRGRREDRVLAAPAVSRAICANKNAHEHTGQREHSGLPCARERMGVECVDKSTPCSCCVQICVAIPVGLSTAINIDAYRALWRSLAARRWPPRRWPKRTGRCCWSGGGRAASRRDNAPRPTQSTHPHW
jgi:hypothetical protein